MASHPKLLWVAVSGDTKTGGIPVAYVGDSLEACEASCEGCGLRPLKRCYAWGGRVRMAFGTVLKGYAETPERYYLTNALVRRRASARALRLSALGDPGRCSDLTLRWTVKQAERHGLAVLAYTHHWQEFIHDYSRRELFMASCNTAREAERALRKGWVPALVVPAGTKGPIYREGHLELLVCPAQRKAHVTCNTCRLCTPAHSVWGAGKIDGIAFLAHDAKARARQKKLTLASKESA